MGSITVLGDLAQGTTPWAAADWRTTLAHLGKPTAAVERLTRGYRVPGTVIDLANRLLPYIADVPPASALRADGEPVRFHAAERPWRSAAAEVTSPTAIPGSIGLIVPDESVREASRALSEPHDVLGPDAERADARVTVVPAGLAKGLEFDSVVLVEPARIATGPRGLNRLYVALTRAVSRLIIVHGQRLPPHLDM